MSFLYAALRKHASASFADATRNSSDEYAAAPVAGSSPASTWKVLGQRRLINGDKNGVEVFTQNGKLATKDANGNFRERHPSEFSTDRFRFKTDGMDGYADSHGVSYSGGEAQYGGAGWGRSFKNFFRNIGQDVSTLSQQAVQGIRDPNFGWASKFWPTDDKGSNAVYRRGPNGNLQRTNAYDSDAGVRSTYSGVFKNSSYRLGTIPLGSDLVKQATEADTGLIKKCDEILQKIYEENPDYWPWGLSRSMFENTPGSELHLVLDKKASEPVGFVGWYEMPRGLRKVGYYSIGVLPQHRKSGFAKEAVSKMIKARAPGVHEVRAMVREGNQPSNALARVLNIQVEKI
jgi:hypothetical protein